MERLLRVCRKLEALGRIAGKNDKKSYIFEHRDDQDFLLLLKARLDPFMQYKMKKFPDVTNDVEPSLTFDEFVGLLRTLSSNNINDKLRRHALAEVSRSMYAITDTLVGIITKTLALGVDTSVNKAVGYELIPTFNVMLAAAMKEGVEPPIPCQVDKKSDGVRGVAMVEDGKCSIYTRKGRLLHFPKLEREAVQLANGADLTFDTELETDARTGISGICNRNLKKGYVEGSDDIIKMAVFDVVPTAVFKVEGDTKIQSERTLELQQLFANHQSKRLFLSESETVYSLEKLAQIAKAYIDKGDEGIIAKDPNAPYYFKRNKAWLKVKAINSTTLLVVGTAEGNGKRKGKVGALICESLNGQVKVNVGSGFSDDDIDTFTMTPPIGSFIEVLFNVLIKGSESNLYSLFLPRYKEMRIDKTEADSLEIILEQHIGKPEI